MTNVWSALSVRRIHRWWSSSRASGQKTQMRSKSGVFEGSVRSNSAGSSTASWSNASCLLHPSFAISSSAFHVSLTRDSFTAAPSRARNAAVSDAVGKDGLYDRLSVSSRGSARQALPEDGPRKDRPRCREKSMGRDRVDHRASIVTRPAATSSGPPAPSKPAPTATSPSSSRPKNAAKYRTA